MGCVVATTTKLTTKTRIEETRARLTLQTIRECRQRGFDIICVDAKSEDTLRKEMVALGATIVAETDSGMGPSRRQAIRAALHHGQGSLPILWTEPEKCTFTAHVPTALDVMQRKRCSMVMFNRMSLDSYPPEQACAYKLVRLACNYLLKVDLDFMFGPLLFDPSVADYFLTTTVRNGIASIFQNCGPYEEIFHLR